MRRKYFRSSIGSLNETVGAVDLAEAIGAFGTDEAQAALELAARLRRMLYALSR
jgi:hypothetical protein